MTNTTTLATRRALCGAAGLITARALPEVPETLTTATRAFCGQARLTATDTMIGI